MVATGWCWIALVLGGVLGSNGIPQRSDPGWLNIDGNDWQRMDPHTRMAYVDGFLAGAALAQAASGARDTSGVKLALEDLKQSGRLRFPFGSNVYVSRLSDYYWWKNHRPLPTWYAFMEVNTALGRRISDSMP
jgi:hypothetical protein